MSNDAVTVRIAKNGYLEFCQNGEVFYDFKPSSPADALRWIEHISRKKWATAALLGNAARLYANNVGIPYP